MRVPERYGSWTGADHTLPLIDSRESECAGCRATGKVLWKVGKEGP
jgi:hypothetical protein